MCYACSRGWFVAELGAAGGWDRVTASWQHHARRVLEPLVRDELAVARRRGSSLRPDQVAVLPADVLRGLVLRWQLASVASLLAAVNTAPLSVAVMDAESELAALVAQVGVERELLELLVAEAQRRGVI